MKPPAAPKGKDDLRKHALNSILAHQQHVVQQHSVRTELEEENAVVQEEESDEGELDEEESGDTFNTAAESGLQFPQKQSKVKLASWEEYWDQRLDIHLPGRCARLCVLCTRTCVQSV